jgi:hypothetical protein
VFALPSRNSAGHPERVMKLSNGLNTGGFVLAIVLAAKRGNGLTR